MEEVKKGSLENDLKAREYFQQAIVLDPEYSLVFNIHDSTFNSAVVLSGDNLESCF